MAGKISRFEVNKKVRRTLIRNSADMSCLQYSCIGKTLTFTGRLQKDDGRDFSATNIEAMLQDLSKIGVQIFSDLENWNFSEGAISKKNNAKEDKAQKEAEAKARANDASKV